MALDDKYDDIKKLIDAGKEKGYLTYDDVNDMLPAEVVPKDIMKEVESYQYQEGSLFSVHMALHKVPEYKAADDFREGLGRVKSNDNKWGYVNKSGTVVIKPAFESADPFVEGLALVEFDGKKGYIDRSGKFVWGPEKD